MNPAPAWDQPTRRVGAPISGPSGEAAARAQIVQVRDLHVEFGLRAGGRFRRRSVLRAVDGVSFAIGERETLGLVGESGSGKSTTGRATVGLVKPAKGSIEILGQSLTEARGKDLRDLRREIQMVFQDPYSSLNPSMTVEDIVAEPLDIHARVSRSTRRERVTETLELVGLDAHHLERYAYEFSGGQRQRIAIARAIILRPKFVVCDEPVSALDVSTQSQIINLLKDLQDELGISYLFIAHDLDVVRHLSQRIAVMYLGKIVEHGPADRVYERPAHPYTEALLSAILSPLRRASRKRIVLQGDLPDPSNPPAGCPFVARCQYAMEVCGDVFPTTTQVEGGGEVACHLQTVGPRLSGKPITELPAGPQVLDAGTQS